MSETDSKKRAGGVFTSNKIKKRNKNSDSDIDTQPNTSSLIRDLEDEANVRNPGENEAIREEVLVPAKTRDISKAIKSQAITPVSGITDKEILASLKVFVSGWLSLSMQHQDELLTERLRYFPDSRVNQNLKDLLRKHSNFFIEVEDSSRPKAAFQLNGGKKILIEECIEKWTIQEWSEVVYLLDNSKTEDVMPLNQTLLQAIEAEVAKKGVIFKYDPGAIPLDDAINSIYKISEILFNKSNATGTFNWLSLSSKDVKKFKDVVKKFFIKETCECVVKL